MSGQQDDSCFQKEDGPPLSNLLLFVGLVQEPTGSEIFFSMMAH